ncbi:MAG: CinA family protein [Bacteroidaceae bacterium]
MNDESLCILCQAIQDRMLARGLTLSTAESCTGGGIAAALTSVSGCSGYFQGGMVAYQNELKVGHLGVNVSDILRYDVVSRPVAEQMVRGACALFRTDYALASTGYAGEGNEHVPAGTIWIAWGSASEVHSCCLPGDTSRIGNTAWAVHEVLRHFLLWLDGNEG